MPSIHSFFSRVNWREWERRSPNDQRKLFSQYESKFKTKPISSTRRNVKKGEHLVVVRKLADKKLYTHHRIVVRVRGDKVDIVEYGYEPSSEDMAASTVLTADVEKLCKIKLKTCTFRELEEEEVFKVKWPRKLRRYGVRAAVRRARSRIGQSSYDFLKNNCEHFVTWCICGLAVSVQVETWHIWARVVVYSAFVAGRELVVRNASNLVPYLLKLLSNVSDEVVVAFVQCAYAAFIIGAVIETGLAIYEIKKAFEQRESGLITNNKLLYARVLGIIAKAVCRFGLATLMSILGAAYGGPVGSLVGGAVGGFAGHFLGEFVGWCLENRAYLDG